MRLQCLGASLQVGIGTSRVCVTEHFGSFVMLFFSEAEDNILQAAHIGFQLMCSLFYDRHRIEIFIVSLCLRGALL